MNPNYIPIPGQRCEKCKWFNCKGIDIGGCNLLSSPGTYVKKHWGSECEEYIDKTPDHIKEWSKKLGEENV